MNQNDYIKISDAYSCSMCNWFQIYMNTKWISDTCYISEPWKLYSKWNKPDPRPPPKKVVYLSTYIEYLE